MRSGSKRTASANFGPGSSRNSTIYVVASECARVRPADRFFAGEVRLQVDHRRREPPNRVEPYSLRSAR